MKTLSPSQNQEKMWRRLRLKQQLRNHVPLGKHQQNEASESSSRPAVKNFAMGWRLKVKNKVTSFPQRIKILSTNSSYQRKVIWMESGATDELRYLPFLRVLFSFSWFPWPVCPFPGFPVWFVVLLRIRGFRDPNLWIHTSNSLCVVSCFFSLFWVHLRTWCTAHCP